MMRQLRDGRRRVFGMFESDRQRVQARLNDAVDIIRVRKAQICLKEFLACYGKKRMEER